MNDDMFESAPAPATSQENNIYLNPKAIEGHLLLLWVSGYVEHSPTSVTREGDRADAVVVDVVDLDQVDSNTGLPGLLSRANWWRQWQIIGALKTKIGNQRPLLAFMTRGSKGYRPFQLDFSASQNPVAVQRAATWLNANRDFAPTPPYIAPTEDKKVEQQRTEDRAPRSEPQRSLLEEMALRATQGAARVQEMNRNIAATKQNVARSQDEEPPF